MSLAAYLRVIAFAVSTVLIAAVPTLTAMLTLGAPRATRYVGVRCHRVWGLLGCFLLGVRREVHGESPRGVFVVASNHLSYLDILVLGTVYPSVFVAKREIARWPLIGIIARSAGTLFVDRESRRDLVRVSAEIGEALQAGVALTFFPEGRISDGERVLPFLPPLLAPAAETGTPCYGVTLTYRVGDPDVDPSVRVCWPQDTPLLPHAVGLAGIRDVTAVVRIADQPIVSRDRKQLASRLHHEVASRFVPVRKVSGYASCAR